MVGSVSIPAEEVGRIAVAQGISVKEARERAVQDTLLSLEARERFDETGQVALARRQALARALLEQLREEARAQGPPTQEEVTKWTQRRWLELDRPAAVKTIHAIVRAEKEDQKRPARALAEKVKKAVAEAKTAEEFRKRAEAVEVEDTQLKVRVEELQAVAADGRVVELDEARGDRGQRYAVEFATGAHAIEELGGKSPIVESSFGFHVIMLLERQPELKVSYAERVEKLRSLIFADRAAQMQAKLLERLESQTPRAAVRAFDVLTQQIRFQDQRQGP